jgi:hypothetical protein
MNNAAEAAAQAGAQAAVVDFARLFAEMQRVGNAVTAQTASVDEHRDALGAITARLAALEASGAGQAPRVSGPGIQDRPRHPDLPDFAGDDGQLPPLEAGADDDDEISHASTADAAVDLLACVGESDPLYKHMHERRFLPASWQHIFNNLSKDASLSKDDILLCNVIIGSVRAVAETLDVTSTHYSSMPPDAKKAFGELYYKLLELQGDYSMALDELLLRSRHTTIQARSVTAAARAKRSGSTTTCNGVAFASPAIADLYANIQCKQAEDALKSFAKSADKTSRPAKDDDDATDKNAAKVAAQAKEITALRQRAVRMEATINKLDPQALKDLKTLKTAKKPAGAAPRAPVAAKTGAAKDAAPPSES